MMNKTELETVRGGKEQLRALLITVIGVINLFVKVFEEIKQYNLL